jgi:hypothetical protein
MIWYWFCNKNFQKFTHRIRRFLVSNISCALYDLECLHLLTYSLEQSPSWEANRFAASQKIPRILGNPKVHYRIHKCPPPFSSVQVRGFVCEYFVTKIRFHGEELLAPRSITKLENHPLSAVRDCLFNIFAATPPYWRPFLYPQPEDAPCRGDRDPLITWQSLYMEYNIYI